MLKISKWSREVIFKLISLQVFSSQSCHHKVRMQCVEYIQAHQDDFKEVTDICLIFFHCWSFSPPYT